MDTLNDLKQLIRVAKRQQSITDTAIERAIHRLKLICKSKEVFEEAEEAVLLFIYYGTNINDKEISIDELMKNIKVINQG